MLNIQEYLKGLEIDSGVYALVHYEGKVEPTYFARYDSKEEGEWYLESPCDLYVECDVVGNLDDFCYNYVYELIGDVDDIEYYIKEFVKPMIVNDVLYSLENMQCSPYLPKEVDKIEIVSERECLLYMLKQEKIMD